MDRLNDDYPTNWIITNKNDSKNNSDKCFIKFIKLFSKFYYNVEDDGLDVTSFTTPVPDVDTNNSRINNWYYHLNCDEYFNVTMYDEYKRQRVRCAMQYLQHEIFPHVKMEKKSFVESDFNCGYSTLTSHQCPIK